MSFCFTGKGVLLLSLVSGRARGQSAIEFLTSLSILFLFAIIFQVFVIQPRVSLADSQKTYFAGKVLCERVAFEINQAGASGSGYYSSFLLPGSVNFNAYNVTVFSNSVVLNWSASSVSFGTVECDIRVKNISFNGNYVPFNLSADRYYSLETTSGVVKIA